ncbi:hypothetical protein HNY73_018604 [Argiope bruennichi]|uniref:Uncharacterized protein n=1 Tax=Argiope bruennichi TaxID=94029 RepID=A0A8T0EDF3_ARGBR|nr:hypothetical protein HNY73_018604 [Argiope bruennichi]
MPDPNSFTTTPLGHNRSPVVKIPSLVHPFSPASPSREAAEDGCREESHPFRPIMRMRSGEGGGRGDRTSSPMGADCALQWKGVSVRPRWEMCDVGMCFPANPQTGRRHTTERCARKRSFSAAPRALGNRLPANQAKPRSLKREDLQSVVFEDESTQDTLTFTDTKELTSISPTEQLEVSSIVSEDRHSLDEEAEEEGQSHTCHSCKLNFDSLSEYLEHLSDDCMTAIRGGSPREEHAPRGTTLIKQNVPMGRTPRHEPLAPTVISDWTCGGGRVQPRCIYVHHASGVGVVSLAQSQFVLCRTYRLKGLGMGRGRLLEFGKEVSMLAGT